MFKSLVVCKRYTFPDNIIQQKLKAFPGIKAEFTSFDTEKQLNKKQSWRPYLLGFADTYTGLLLPFPSTALPLSGSRKWRNNVILFLASFNEIYRRQEMEDQRHGSCRFAGAVSGPAQDL